MKKIYLALIASLFSVNSWATLLIDAGSGSSIQSFSGGDYVAGTEFTLASSTLIDGLGYIDIGNDGLLEDHRVGLWNDSGSLLVEATVSNSSTIVASGSFDGRWYIEQIDEILLSAGIYRVAGLVGNEAFALSGDKIGNDAVLTSGYVRTDFPDGGFDYPNLSFSSEAVRATVTTGQFTATPVPEPASLAIFALGLVALGISRKHIAS